MPRHIIRPAAIAAATVLTAAGLANPPATAEDFWEAVFAEPQEKFGGVMADPAAHRVQVLVSEVVPADAGPPTLRRHHYRVDAEYFYPASAIKVAGCVAALLEVQRWQAEFGSEVTAETPLSLRFADGRVEDTDGSNVADGTINVRHDIRKVCMESDNAAFNRQFDLAGRDRLNRTMWEAGLKSFRLRHQLIGGKPNERRGHPTQHPGIALQTQDAVHHIPPHTSRAALPSLRPVTGYRLGKAYVDRKDRRTDQPFDFASRNEVSLVDLQDLLVMIARPDIDLGKPGLPLSDEHRALLIEAMTQDPRTSANPVYPDPPYHEYFADTWAKDGIDRVVDRHKVRETEKGGTAYGFKVMNAYFVHEPTERAFFLTATAYSNPNATFNDNDYGYKPLSVFLVDLGEAVARQLWARGSEKTPTR